MRKIKFIIISLLCLFIVACSAGGMNEVQQSGFLNDYSMLSQGGENSAAMTYIKPGTDFKPYNKIMFERVLVILSSDAGHRGIDPALYKELTDYYLNALLNAVKGGYEVVDQPGPGVLRVRTAITDLKPSKPVSNTMSTILPVGWAVAGITKVVSDDNLGTGEAATEIDVLDSVTGERLAAAVDRRQGGKAVFEGKWEDTKDAFDHWAARFRSRLDKLRGM